MKTYKVRVKEIVTYDIEVEADDENAAVRKAKRRTANAPVTNRYVYMCGIHTDDGMVSYSSKWDAP